MRTKYYDVEHVGKKIQKRREDKKLSLDDLSKKAGISKATISRFENGKSFPSIYVFARLCEALHISMDNIFSYQDKK